MTQHPTQAVPEVSSRRRFLAGTLAAASAAMLPRPLRSVAQALPTRTFMRPDKMRGVNLGGWLVLEKWMTPSLFKGTTARDEWEFSSLPDGAARLKAHRESYITADDFAWIAARGLNMVRIPVGHWILEATAPYHAAPERLDWAFEQAQRHGLGVLLDLHGAPGSQNGNDHSGKKGPIEWHKKPENIQSTLRVLEALARRYARQPNLVAFQPLNEPHHDVPLDIVKPFYQEAYRRVRRHLPKERVSFVIHDGFRPFEWKEFMTEPEYSNVMLDAHLYQVFSEADRKRNAGEHIRKATEHKGHIDAMQNQLWTIVGEWSAAMPPESLKELTPLQVDAAKRAFAAAQLLSYEASHGWFFWSYENESNPEWSLRDCVARGWLPDKFT
jgi:glucan 1,3-beta-glucosidase